MIAVVPHSRTGYGYKWKLCTKIGTFIFLQVLENYSDAPMTPKQILQVIEAEGLKEMRFVLFLLFKSVS